MASYAAVCSLQQTIQRLRNSSTISILPTTRKILERPYEWGRFLQEEYLGRLKGSSGERVNAVNAGIREAASKFEDAIFSHVSNQFLSQAEGHINIGSDQIISVDLNLEEVKQELFSFLETTKRVVENNRIEDLLAEEDDNIPLRTDLGGKCSKMVGFSDLFSNIKDKVTDSQERDLNFVSLVGMTGIGKTTLALKIFEDPETKTHFEHRAFVDIGPKYKLREVMLDILAQLTPDIDEIHEKGVDEVGEYLLKTLNDRRYLIVLDDVWDIRFELFEYLPNCRNQSRILVTSRIVNIVDDDDDDDTHCYDVPFLNEEESWDLLCERVFGEGSLCPIQLEKHGKKIAKNCEGLPLTIVVVAGILSKNDKTPEYWEQTAEEKNSVFTDAYNQMFPVLFPSYKYLHQYLKPIFLYTGVFPPRKGFTTSKIVKLLTAEDFLEPSSALVGLEKVSSRSLLQGIQQSSVSGGKTWSIHSANWHLCSKMARMEKFFYVINSYPSSISTEDIKSQQRLCVHNNVLLGIKEVNNSIESISTVRSLLCTGPHHQYPVTICFSLRFLRVLDALTVRFYKFPIEVLKLVQLRYLALTCNGNVPASISKLWNLEYFFVRRHLSIKPSGAWPCLPMQIWNMKELRHLQVMGSNLPYHSGAMLPNLLTLSDMSADSCTAEILRGTPNLEKLGVQIELPPDAAEPLSFFDHPSHLHKLRSLKCIVVNPKPMSHLVAPLTAFPSNLRKLNLSGFGYPWKYMSMIAELPCLSVLKLQRYAFQGPEWTTEGKFRSLEFLLIEETDLVQWVADGWCFPKLGRLMVRHCYKLKGLPRGIWYSLHLKMIELVDCPSAVNSAKQIQEEMVLGVDDWPELCVQSSWDDGKVKS